MILGRFKLYALGTLLAGFAAPSLAAAPADGAGSRPIASADGKAASVHPRRVDLPFLLEPGTAGGKPRAPAPKGNAAPHPFRDDLPNRAARGEGAAFA